MTKARQATATTSRLARIARRAILAALAPRAFLPGAKGSGAPSSSRCDGTGAPSACLVCATALASLLATAASLVLTAAPAAASEPCPNEAFRTGPSAALPDCRAYEMVSPVDKNGGDILPAPNFSGSTTALDQSLPSGARLTYTSSRAFGDVSAASYASQYMATSGASGWSTHALSPPRGSSIGFPIPDGEFAAFTPDLSSAFLWHNSEPALAPGAVLGFPNLYRRDNSAESYEALTTITPPSPELAENPERFSAVLQGFSADASHVVFAANAALTPEAPELGVESHILYESFQGKLSLISILPDGSPATAGYEGFWAGTRTGPNEEHPDHINSRTHAVSADGSRVFWSGNGSLYVRENATAEPTAGGECTPAEPTKSCTLEISPGAFFWTASSDGSKVVFQAEEELYEFDVDTQTATLITPKALGVAGASEDASHVYFVSTEALPGSGQNPRGAVAQAGQPNLYLHHGAATVFIATLSPSDVPGRFQPSDVATEPVFNTARVTPDGHAVAFLSAASLTGYDNADAVSGEPDAELYLYDATANGGQGELNCVSCNPSGTRPAGTTPAWRGSNPRPMAARLPLPSYSIYPGRALSDNGGRIFFEAYDALSPHDTNGVTDVYEWEALGEGPPQATCTEESPTYSAQGGGCVSLISSGKSPQESNFVDASSSGGDVFITTNAGLLPQDPGLVDIYDARALGGFPPPPSPPAACEGEACQTPPPPPNDPTPASSAYSGPGNVGQRPKCRRGFARRHGRCAKRHHRKAHKRHANTNQRAAR